MSPAIRILWFAAVASAASILAGVGTLQSRAMSQESAEAALAALGASVDVERDLLKTQQELYRRAASERESAGRRLQQLLTEMDGLVQSPDPASSEQIAAKDREIVDVERQRSAALERARTIADRIQETQERVAGLERKIAVLRDTLPKARESLTGSWQVTYMPGANKGVFTLRQSGAIVQGQYQLEGGWKGSLQGTFVNGKVRLERIDSKLGRSSELQGYLSADGKSIRGTWQNFNLTDGSASSGSWTASRQED